MRVAFHPSFHEVEGYIQGVDVTVVRVIDQRQSTLAFLHLQTHGDGFQMCHPLGNLFWRKTQRECCCSTGDRVLNTSLINKGYLITTLYTFIIIRHTIAIGLDEHRCFFAIARPTDTFTLILRTTYTTAHRIIVGRIDDDCSISEQLQLLHTFLVHRTEILLMGTAQ